MTDKKGEIVNSFGTAIIIALFLFLFYSLSDKPVNLSNKAERFELKADINTKQAKAVIADAVLLPTVQKSFVCLLNSLSGDNNQISSFNRKTNSANI